MLAERARACQVTLKCGLLALLPTHIGDTGRAHSGALIVAELPGSFGLLTPWRSALAAVAIDLVRGFPEQCHDRVWFVNDTVLGTTGGSF